MNNPVTLPREVVEQVRGALAYVGAGNSSTNPNLAQSTCRQAIWKLDHALRAVLEQPHTTEQSYMEGVTAGRHELASEYPLPTDLYDSKDWCCGTYAERVEWLHTMYEDAKEQIAALEQPQAEQEPVAWIWAEWSSRKLTFDGPPAVPSVRDELTKPVWTPLYTRPQPKQPLTDEAVIDAFCTTPNIHQFVSAFKAGVRFAERTHGIGGEV